MKLSDGPLPRATLHSSFLRCLRPRVSRAALAPSLRQGSVSRSVCVSPEARCVPTVRSGRTPRVARAPAEHHGPAGPGLSRVPLRRSRDGRDTVAGPGRAECSRPIPDLNRERACERSARDRIRPGPGWLHPHPGLRRRSLDAVAPTDPGVGLGLLRGPGRAARRSGRLALTLAPRPADVVARAGCAACRASGSNSLGARDGAGLRPRSTEPSAFAPAHRSLRSRVVALPARSLFAVAQTDSSVSLAGPGFRPACCRSMRPRPRAVQELIPSGLAVSSPLCGLRFRCACTARLDCRRRFHRRAAAAPAPATASVLDCRTAVASGSPRRRPADTREGISP